MPRSFHLPPSTASGDGRSSRFRLLCVEFLSEKKRTLKNPPQKNSRQHLHHKGTRPAPSTVFARTSTSSDPCPLADDLSHHLGPRPAPSPTTNCFGVVERDWCKLRVDGGRARGIQACIPTSRPLSTRSPNFVVVCRLFLTGSPTIHTGAMFRTIPGRRKPRSN